MGVGPVRPASAVQPRSTHRCSPGKDEYDAAFRSHNASALAGIYREQINIAIWQRRLSRTLESTVESILRSGRALQIARTVAPERAATCIATSLHISDTEEFCLDVAELVDMFCCLFGRKTAGLRLTALHHAMCPRFHVDNVPCRLVTTYQGPATQWLPHACVNRSVLGAGNQGKPDAESGLYEDSSDIQQLGVGDVGLLKGEYWEGNENAGLVHRSPEVLAGESRLLLTLDIAD